MHSPLRVACNTHDQGNTDAPQPDIPWQLEPPQTDSDNLTSGTVVHESAWGSKPSGSLEEIGVKVFVPYCQPVNGRVITDRTAGQDGLCANVKTLVRLPFPEHDCVAVLRPQQFLGMMDVISYHSILDHLPTPARAVVLDLSRVGGHCHATVLPACTTWETVADQVCKLLNLDIFEEPVNIWKGDHMELIDKFSIFHLQHGDTLIFMRGDLAPPVVFTAADFFGAGVKWYGFAHLPGLSGHSLPCSLYRAGLVPCGPPLLPACACIRDCFALC